MQPNVTSVPSRFAQRFLNSNAVAPPSKRTVRQGTSIGQRVGLACLAIAISWAFAGVSHADVTATGDVSPTRDVDGGGGQMIKVPDLPEFGGIVDEDTGRVIVGGTGMQIGDTDTGLVTIDDPFETDPLQSKEAFIGGDPDDIINVTQGQDVGVGQVRILGLGSEWRVEDRLVVGGTGQGFLNLLAGGKITSNSDDAPSVFEVDTVVGYESTSQGFVVVDGFGSAMIADRLTVGLKGFARVDVRNLSRLEARDEAVIGDFSNFEDSGPDAGIVGTGFVLVDGQGTRFNVGDFSTGVITGSRSLTVGRSGRGTLEVRNQGLTRTEGDIFIGRRDDGFGQVLVDGQGSTLLSFKQIFVGDNTGSTGAGELHIDNNGLARAVDSVVVGPRGRVEFNGGVLLAPDTVNEGIIAGTGRVDSRVANGVNGDIRNAAGLANTREKLLFTQTVANSGLIESLGGEMEFLQQVTNAAAGQIAGRDAVYRFRSATAGQFGLENAGSLFFSAGESDIFGRVRNAATGDISVGHETILTFYDNLVSDGLINILAGGVIIAPQDVTLSSTSTFSVTLADLGPGEFGLPQLQVAGAINLAGTLDPGIFGFTPSMGEEFVIIDANQVNGTFASIVQPRDFAWEAVYNPGNVVLRAIAPPAGGADFDGDGDVDGDDLAAWQANFGTATGATLIQGDANGDGDVDGFDFLEWQAQFGSVPSTLASSAVPEPTTLGLVFLLSLGGSRGRKRQR